MTTELTGRTVNKSGSAGTLPIIGKIKVGEKVKNAAGKEYPTSLDYFKATGEYTDMFTEAYGDKPNNLTIIFTSNDPVQACNEVFECRNEQGRKTGFGDGATWYLWNSDTKQMEKTNDRDKALAFGKWKKRLRLRFLLPKIQAFGIWELTTGGEASSIPQIRDTFDFVANLAPTIVGIPFDLIVDKVKSDQPDSKSSYPVLKLVPKLSTQSMEGMGKLIEQGVALPLIVTNEFVTQEMQSVKQLTQGGV